MAQIWLLTSIPVSLTGTFSLLTNITLRTESGDIEFLAADESTVFQKFGGNQRMFADKSKQIHSMSRSRPNTRRNKNISFLGFHTTFRSFPEISEEPDTLYKMNHRRRHHHHHHYSPC